MSDSPYLIALALVKKNEERAMPLGGKTVKQSFKEKSILDDKFQTISLELLLRLFDKTESFTIHRANKENSILLTELPLIAMTEQLPILKQNWIQSGDTYQLIKGLKSISNGVWSINFKKHTGITTNKL